MKTLEIIVTITSDGKMLVNSPVDMPVGDYNAVLVIEEQPIRNNLQPSVQNVTRVDSGKKIGGFR